MRSKEERKFSHLTRFQKLTPRRVLQLRAQGPQDLMKPFLVHKSEGRTEERHTVIDTTVESKTHNEEGGKQIEHAREKNTLDCQTRSTRAANAKHGTVSGVPKWPDFQLRGNNRKKNGVQV